MKKLGVIGGLGPMATALFMEMVIEMTEALTDQSHIEMLIHNCPSIPDRTGYILGKSEADPVPPMIRVGRGLAEAGAEVIAIPCVTAHFFYDRLSREIPAPIINAVEETGAYLAGSGVKRAGLMATDGTINTGLFNEELKRRGIESVVPGEKAQGYIMDIIYNDIKAGKPADMDKFCQAADELRAEGAEVIILGCTELSMVRKDEAVGSGYLDAMQVLARQSVALCGTLKKEYGEIITD